MAADIAVLTIPPQRGSQEAKTGEIMASQESERGMEAGDRHYKAFVGPVEIYDLMGAMQFNLLTTLGLRQDHTLLDVGCGSLRAGKLFIPYLRPGHYFGIEPEQWLIDEGIEQELGRDCLRIKRPRFDNNAGFQFGVFGTRFDYIIVHSIFSHADPSQVRACLSEAAKVMTPTSIFVATYLAGDEDYQGNAWVYPERVTYRLRSMIAMTKEAGLAYVPIPWSHPTGQAWFAAVNPDSEDQIRELSGDPLALPMLKARLAETEERLQRTRQHPYVRFGVWMRSLLRRRWQ